MEEIAGKLWDRFMTRVTDTRHTEAAVTLPEISRTAGILFRALGGDSGLSVKAAQATEHGARRSWLQRLAGSGGKSEFAWRDQEALYLPEEIALFPDRTLNRDLYLWLIALAAEMQEGDWFMACQHATLRVFERYPGFEPRYRQLVDAALRLRPNPNALPAEEAACETALQTALREPGSVPLLPKARKPWQPVPLWLHPNPPIAPMAAANDASDPDGAERTRRDRIRNDSRRRHAERVDMPDGKDGFMLLFRAESILSWADYIRVNRPNEDDEDSNPSEAADDFKRLSMARDGKTTAARVRFDLDLPPAHADDAPLGPGILLPEWQHRKRALQPGYCRVQPMLATTAPPCGLPPHLAVTARRIRRQFEALTPGRVWLKHQFDGSELDLDACIEHATDRHLKRPAPERGLYRDIRARQRDLACLLLADLSLSTDAYVSNEARVIDVIRDTLFLFSEALSVTGDRFGLYGFSSLRRDNVRFHVLKDFSERYDNTTRGRIAALKPGYYTRMGAAIRHATTILSEQRAQQRLMLILTDGKPNDLDHYEGRHGIEDTRHAILEAREKGLQPFCVTVDEKGSDYLSHLFGLGRYVVIRKPADLPKQLPLLYAQLTA
jgi:nitric oxide reductase NorD protein